MGMNGMSFSLVQNDTSKDSYKTSLDRIIQIPSTLRFSIMILNYVCNAVFQTQNHHIELVISVLECFLCLPVKVCIKMPQEIRPGCNGWWENCLTEFTESRYMQF